MKGAWNLPNGLESSAQALAFSCNKKAVGAIVTFIVRVSRIVLLKLVPSVSTLDINLHHYLTVSPYPLQHRQCHIIPPTACDDTQGDVVRDDIGHYSLRKDHM